MCSFILLVFNIAAFIIISEGVFTCPSLFNWYPDIYDCRKFYRCMWGKSNSFTCPTGTLWSQELLTCDHEDHVKCGKSSNTQSVYQGNGLKIVEAPDFSVDFDLQLSHVADSKGGHHYHGTLEKDAYKLDSHTQSGQDETDHVHSQHAQEEENDSDSESSEHKADNGYSHSGEHNHGHLHHITHNSEPQIEQSEGKVHAHHHSTSEYHRDDDNSHSEEEEEEGNHSSHSHEEDNDDNFHLEEGSHHDHKEDSPSHSPLRILPVQSSVHTPTNQPTYLVQQPQQTIVPPPQPLMSPPRVVVQPPQTLLPVLIPQGVSASASTKNPSLDEAKNSLYADFILGKLLQLPRYGGSFYKPINVINTDGTYDVLDLQVSPQDYDIIQKIEPYRLKKVVPTEPWPLTDFFRAGYGYKRIYHKK